MAVAIQLKYWLLYLQRKSRVLGECGLMQMPTRLGIWYLVLLFARYLRQSEMQFWLASEDEALMQVVPRVNNTLSSVGVPVCWKGQVDWLVVLVVLIVLDWLVVLFVLVVGPWGWLLLELEAEVTAALFATFEDAGWILPLYCKKQFLELAATLKMIVSVLSLSSLQQMSWQVMSVALRPCCLRLLLTLSMPCATQLLNIELLPSQRIKPARELVEAEEPLEENADDDDDDDDDDDELELLDAWLQGVAVCAAPLTNSEGLNFTF